MSYSYLTLAVSLEPDNSKLRYLLGRQCVRTRRYREGIEHLQYSLGVTGEHAPTIGFLMECYEAMNKPKVALRLVKKYPKSLAHTKVRDCYIKTHFSLGNYRKLSKEFATNSVQSKESRRLIDLATKTTRET